MPPQSQSNCPAGTRFRRGHTRKFTKGQAFTVQGNTKTKIKHHQKNSAFIPSACVHPKQTRKMNNGLRKGELLKYGYSFRLPDKQRHSALKKAVKTLGASYVYGILGQGAKLAKNVHSDAYTKFTLDMEFLKKQAV